MNFDNGFKGLKRCLPHLNMFPSTLVFLCLFVCGISIVYGQTTAVTGDLEFKKEFSWDMESVSINKKFLIPPTIEKILNYISESLDKNLRVSLYGYTRLTEALYAVVLHINIKKGKSQDYLSRSLGKSELLDRQEALGIFLYQINRDKKKDNILAHMFKLGSVEEYTPTTHGSSFGCLLTYYPVMKIDIDSDGRAELVIVSGKPNQVNDGIHEQLNLSLYDDEFNQVLSIKMREDNYTNRYPPLYVKYDEHLEETEPNQPGLKIFTKLYFSDFDENKKQDILIWQRFYQPKKITKTNKSFFINDWYFKDERFDLYTLEEGMKFTRSLVDNKQAHQWLQANKLDWRAGFPNKNVCTHQAEDSPVTQGINDPVIRKKGGR